MRRGSLILIWFLMLMLLLAACFPRAQARAATPPILINEFMPAPSSGAEWVELYNPNMFEVALAGWKIDDETIDAPQTTIAAGTIIPAGGLLVIALTSNILNNSGSDAVQLLDAGGSTISIHGYSNASSTQSFARTPDGSETWSKSVPSQGSWNVPPGPALATATSTDTPTNTPTATNPAVPLAATGTATPVYTATPTLTAAPTHTPSNTAAPSPTNTATPSHTPSPTATPYADAVLLTEFMANPTSGGKEWVELFNANSFAVDLSGWKIDDIDGGQAPYSLPANTIISASQYFTITLPSAIFNNDGDSVRLLRPDGSVADITTYSSSNTGWSRARSADQGWYDEATPSPGSPNPAPATPTHTPSSTATALASQTPTNTASATPGIWPAGIIISEFLAYPKIHYTGEWVELYNTSDTTADLAGWQLDDGAGGAAPYSLPAGSTLAPASYLVVELPGAILNNDGDSVRLLRPDGILADTTTYSSSSADLSYSRNAQGVWYMSAINTPGQPNAAPVAATPTNTATATRTPSPTRVATATRTPSPTRVATATRTPSPTRVATATRTPSPTRVATATRTPSPTRVPTATRTPKPTTAPARVPNSSVATGIDSASAIRLNEFLPYPKAGYTNEWVELGNDGELPIDLGEWAIDDASGGGTPYHLPTGTLIAAHGLLLVELPKALLNNSGDMVRLLRPDNSVADQYQFKQAAADMSYCRMQQAWRTCTPSPSQPNQAEHAAPEPPALKQPRAEQSTPLEDPAPDAHITVQQIAERRAGAAVLQSMAWIHAESSPAPTYALPGGGALYGGLAQATPTSRPAMPAIAPLIGATPAANPDSAGTASPPLSAGIGAGLLLVSGVAAGYERLRRRRQSSAPETAEPAEEQRQNACTPESML